MCGAGSAPHGQPAWGKRPREAARACARGGSPPASIVNPERKLASAVRSAEAVLRCSSGFAAIAHALHEPPGVALAVEGAIRPVCPVFGAVVRGLWSAKDLGASGPR